MINQLQKMSESLPFSSYRLLPKKPGIYLFLDENDNVLYAGKARDLRSRVGSYFAKNSSLGEKTRVLITKTRKIKTIVAYSEVHALLLEANCIKKYEPRYNIRLRDGKAYPLIRITRKDKYPKALTARREEDKSSLYFAPVPNSGALRLVLRTIRRLFPFQSVLNHPKRICLYNHLGLCPCPPYFDSEILKSEYRKNIRHLVSFLNGNINKIQKELEIERNNFAKREEFEKAQNIQKKISAIALISDTSYKKFDYDLDPNLRDDLRRKEIESLKQHLSKHSVTIKKLNRIECYDISNISGYFATGSMVVFINGESDKSLYRRFKIRRVIGPNDYAMLREVFQRRMKHADWPMPDLLIVDGGRGQVLSALEVLKKLSLNIPLIGLAKREETIVTSDLKEISLPKSSIALKLLMRIRDEAHRFAISYHRHLRSKIS